MADEIRVNDSSRAAHTHRDQLVVDADVQATIQPDQTAVAVPDDPEAARAEIEVTRARMSETIDEIEDALLRKKERIQDKLDVFAPVRRSPLPSVGIALGAGVLFGLITAGDDDEDDDHRDFSRSAHRDEYLRELEERADSWESRARRLLRIAQEQEEELERFSGRTRAADGESDHRSEESHGGGSTMDRLRDQILAGVSGYISTAVHQMVSSRIGNRSH